MLENYQRYHVHVETFPVVGAALPELISEHLC